MLTETIKNYLKTTFWLISSITTSVGVILANKVIMQPPFNFVYVFTLTSIHFFVTALIMELMAVVGVFTRSWLPWMTAIVMAVACSSAVGLANMSLKLNSVGFYQLCKLLGIPYLVIIQAIFYKTHTSCVVKLSLLLIVLGMGSVTVTDVQLNVAGTVVGLVGVIIVTQFHIWQGQNQHAYKLNALQINYAQALPTFLVCALLALTFEFSGFHQSTNIWCHKWTFLEIKWIGLSAILAAFANLTCYGLIGNTSAITFQVTGHIKTVLILLGGYFITGDQSSMNANHIIGILICLSGSVAYGALRYAEQVDINVDKLFSITRLSKRFCWPWVQKRSDGEAEQSLTEL